VGSINLFKAMEKHGCRNVVFSSSATVYGALRECLAPPPRNPAKPSRARRGPFRCGAGFAREMPIKEEESLKPTNPYGRTKLFLEEMLRDIASGRDGDQWRVVLLR
jgi:UDP-glucose 4-epimerase